MMRDEIDLSAGTIQYHDTGGDGPVLVLLHGLLMDASLWDTMVAELSVDHRCISPTLPLGAHRQAARPDADLSLKSIARLVVELLERLDLRDVILVGSDTGGALVQLALCQDSTRVGTVVLSSCDAFDNLPPGLSGKALVLAAKLPPRIFGLFMQQMRLKPLRRSRLAFGWLTRHGDAATAAWMRPLLREPAIRRDAVRVLRSISADPDQLVEAARCLPAFDRPALIVWASEDRVMPLGHGRRLAGLFPRGRLVEIADRNFGIARSTSPARVFQPRAR